MIKKQRAPWESPAVGSLVGRIGKDDRTMPMQVRDGGGSAVFGAVRPVCPLRTCVFR
jgi:hypothetical protein